MQLVRKILNLNTLIKIAYKIIVEELKLIGEGEYNLNNLKEIRVTESYLGLDEDVRQCQHEEPLNNCTTRQYLNTLLGECGCLPINIRPFHKKVHLFRNKSKKKYFLHFLGKSLHLLTTA